MKSRFYFFNLCLSFFTYSIGHAQNKTTATQYANTSLSNLVSPAINVSLLPDKNNSHNIGNSTKAWRNLYLDSAIYFQGQRFISSDRPNNTYGNLAIGFYSLLHNKKAEGNLAIGENALESNSTGILNTAVGQGCLSENDSGYYNTGVGEEALSGNFNGSENTAAGTFSLLNNYSGSQNTAIGKAAMYYNYSGNYNTAIGTQALAAGGIANATVAVGYDALYNSGGDNCTAVGTKAGYNNYTGIDNTYLGYHAGNTVTTGSSNTIIGYGADVANADYSNATALGNLTVVGGSNHVRIGNSSVTIIGGQVSWSTLSDARIKNNIQQNVPGLQFINLLKPVTYHYDVNKQDNLLGRKTEDWNGKYDIEKIQFTGFIAQDVEAAAKKIGYDFSGVAVPKSDKDFYSLRYSDFIVPLVKAVQELSKQNDSLKNVFTEKLSAQQKEIYELKEMIVSNQSTVNSQQSTAVSFASLQQNIPNPFSNSTTINYSLPAKFISAKIIITDKNGNALKTNALSNGKGAINVDATTLASGAYQYSLYVDGKMIASKQFIVSK